MNSPEFPDELWTAILKTSPLRFADRIYCGPKRLIPALVTVLAFN